MRLRTRYFLISWPLVVLAIIGVALGVDRWTVVELDRIEQAGRPVRDRSRDAMWADSLIAQWQASGSPPSSAALARLTANASPRPSLVLLDSAGQLIATGDTAVRVRTPPASTGEMARFVRRMVRGGEQTEALLALDGMVLRTRSSRTLGALYVLPPAPEPTPGRAAERGFVNRGAALRRRIWSVAAIACLAAAAAALLLAGPLVARVRRIAGAARDIREGALDTRVDERGGDELAELGRNFNAMAASLARARDNQRKLVGDVAHELRTPLTNVMGLVEAMQDGLKPANAATLATLHNEVGLLASLVHDLQELSLAESGQLRLDIRDVDAVAVGREAVEAMLTITEGQTLGAPETSAPVFVRADRPRLGQILRNLLRNAITHTPAGGHVGVTVHARAETVIIVVSDTGSGIPPEHLPLVFERFHRVDPSRARTSGGMGLGLALVRELANAMGGRVWVESESGNGSRFGVELPAPDDTPTSERPRLTDIEPAKAQGDLS